MARKFLYLIVVVIVLIIAALLALRLWGTELAQMAFVPKSEFVALTPVAPAAYDDPKMWISHPAVKDQPAAFLPKGAAAPAETGKAVVFYIHPTTYLNRASWNAPLDDKDANDRALLITRMQASVFGASGSVWVPRYRQATFGSFLGGDGASAAKAHDAAYKDVQVAFETFLKANEGKAPIILAGHSQGARHLLHLLRDHVAGKPVAARVVAAYVIGWPVSQANDLPSTGMKACTDPAQTGCLLSWQSFGEPAEIDQVLGAFDKGTGLNGKPNAGTQMVCTNPLTGGKGVSASASANRGALKAKSDLSEGELFAQLVPARCDGRGFLLIGEGPDMGSYMFPGNNYHVYDYSLFWENMRGDVAARLAAFKPAP